MRIAFAIPILLAALFLSCTSPPEPGVGPRVEWFEPTSGPRGSVVTIHGHDFSKGRSAIGVSFGGERAQILSASDSVIVVVVPGRANTGHLGVSNGSGSSSSRLPFTITFSAGAVQTAGVVIEDLPIDQILGERDRETTPLRRIVERTTFTMTEYGFRNPANLGGTEPITFTWGFPVDSGYDHRVLAITIDTAASRISLLRYTRNSLSAATHLQQWSSSTVSDTLILRDIPYSLREHGQLVARIATGKIPAHLETLGHHERLIVRDYEKRSYYEFTSDILEIFPDALEATITITLK
jgi:IPT/TIG domain